MDCMRSHSCCLLISTSVVNVFVVGVAWVEVVWVALSNLMGDKRAWDRADVARRWARGLAEEASRHRSSIQPCDMVPGFLSVCLFSVFLQSFDPVPPGF